MSEIISERIRAIEVDNAVFKEKVRNVEDTIVEMKGSVEGIRKLVNSLQIKVAGIVATVAVLSEIIPRFIGKQ